MSWLTFRLYRDRGQTGSCSGCIGWRGNWLLFWLYRREGELAYVLAIERQRSAYNISLAYATTVHQVEGQSLNSVAVVYHGGFHPTGWSYTAITRARSINRLYLIGQPRCREFRPRPLVCIPARRSGHDLPASTDKLSE